MLLLTVELVSKHPVSFELDSLSLSLLSACKLPREYSPNYVENAVASLTLRGNIDGDACRRCPEEISRFGINHP